MSGRSLPRKRKAEGDQPHPSKPRTCLGDVADSGAQLGQDSLNGPLRRSQWTPEEDDILRAAVEKYGYGSWKSIAKLLKHRTDTQCMSRWQRVLDPSVNKGPWTKEEDARLSELVVQYGNRDWSLIASHMPGRINKQCRERWSNQLDPSIKRGGWSPEEDATIARLQAQLGNQWAQIARHFPGRTDNAIKNRWNATIYPRIQRGTIVVPEASNASLATVVGQGTAAATPAASSVACSPPPLFRPCTQKQQQEQQQQARGGRPGLRSFGRVGSSSSATPTQLQFGSPEARPPLHAQRSAQGQAASGSAACQAQQQQQQQQLHVQQRESEQACEASVAGAEAASSQAPRQELAGQQPEHVAATTAAVHAPEGNPEGASSPVVPPTVLGVQTRRRQRQLILAVPPGTRFPFQPPAPAPAPGEHTQRRQQQQRQQCVVGTAPQPAVGGLPAGSSRAPARALRAQPSSDSASSSPLQQMQGSSDGALNACAC